MINSRESFDEMHPNRKVFYAFGTLYPHLTGGMEVFNYHFLKYLMEIRKQDLLYFSDHAMENHEIQWVAFRHRRPFRLTYPIQFFWQVYKHRKEIGCVVTTFSEQSWIIPFLQTIILRLFRKPYYVVIHWGGMPESRWDLPLRVFFKNAVSIITVSEQIKQAYLKRFRSGHFKYIPPLIPFERSELPREELTTRWGLPRQSRIILFVGSLKSMKNPDSLVEAAIKMGAEQLKEQKLHFIFAGSGHLMDELKEQCEQAGIQEYIHFPGLVARHQMPELYKIADLYVIASDYEGTPLSLLEAFYNGIPVIASDVSGISSLIADGQNGVLFPVKQTDLLLNAIKKLLNDPIEAARLGKAGHSYYHQHFSYEQMIDEYEKLLSPDPPKAKILHIDDFKKGKVKPIKSLK